MGRTSAISVAAVAACGYGAVHSFVPAFPASETKQAPSLRASAETAPSSSGSASTTASTVLVAGSLAAVAVRGTRRQATATAQADAPPPPPPFNPSEQIGATAPLGFFDPLGFSKVGDEDGFRRLRIAELKHGRVAMMASVGAVVQHYTQFPGFQAVPKGLFAVTSGNGTIGFAALVLISGAFELLLWKDKEGPVSKVGDYGNPFQLGLGEPLGEGDHMKTAELNNGRAAMFATLGIVVAELVTGKDGMQQLGFS